MRETKGYGLGLVIGKFLPPHAGHHHVIDVAARECGEVVVIVCHREDDAVPPGIRELALRERHPEARIMVVEDHYDPDDSRLWADLTRQWLGGAPDSVFSSEPYGEVYARFLGCAHVMVDHDRLRYPVSGTKVRNDPFSQWEFLSPVMREWYAVRVVMVGAESTGTTTLAGDLAKEWGVDWVSEYGREYCETKYGSGDFCWDEADFLNIAGEQMVRENRAARMGRGLVICDTNAWATMLWHRRYRGHDSMLLEGMVRGCRCDLYVLTGAEIPFVQDGLRDGEFIRLEMQNWFRQELARGAIPWMEVSGSPEERVKQVIHEIRSRFPLLAAALAGP